MNRQKKVVKTIERPLKTKKHGGVKRHQLDRLTAREMDMEAQQFKYFLN